VNQPTDATGAPLDAVDRIVGERIRKLRRTRKMSLKDLAAKTGLSIGFLSQMERGLSSPSLRSMTLIADVFGVSLGALFEQIEGRDGDVTIVVRAGDRPELNLWRSGITKQLLTPNDTKGSLNVFLVRLAPQASTGDELYTHQGEEAGLILSGTMTLVVDSRTFQLDAGDSFRFASTRPHRFSNPTENETVVVWINYVD
jgi:transcriptional regulator with XRE-family HTH domain